MENEETYMRRRRKDKALEEIINLLFLAIILCGIIIIACIQSASAYYSGETIEKNATEFGLFYFSNVWIQENNTFINLTWTNQTFKVIIPETYVGNIRVGFQGYNDKPQIITDSYSGGGGSSYLPKKSIVIYPNETSDNSHLLPPASNDTNPELNVFYPIDSRENKPSLFNMFWDWIKALWQRLFG